MNSNKFDLSIVVTFCNQDNFIDEVLNKTVTVFSTSLFKCQILVGLDHPSEEAKLRAKKFECDNLKVLEFASDKNLIALSRASQNRLFLLRHADSEFSLILDGNDLTLTNVDEAIIFLRENNEFSGYAYNHIGYDQSTKTHKIKDAEYKNLERVTFEKHLKLGKYFHSNCVVFRRKLALAPTISLYCKDTLLVFFLLSQGDICYSEKILMQYSEGILSICSRADQATQHLSALIVLEELYRNIFNNSKFSCYFAQRISKYILKRSKNNFGASTINTVSDCYKHQIESRNLPLSKILLSVYNAKTINFRSDVIKYLKTRARLLNETEDISRVLPTIEMYWWKGENIGDELSSYLCKKIFENKYFDVNVEFKESQRSNNFVSIGSILSYQILMLQNTVWGSGTLTRESIKPLYSLNLFTFYKKNSWRLIYQKYFNKNFCKIFAVRGKLTRELLINNGFKCPEIYGDPAILLPKFYSPKILHLYNCGIVLHHSQCSLFTNASIENVKFIKTVRKGDKEIEEFIDELASCEKIFSSSLHGLIIAQAYGIPAQWIELENFPIHEDAHWKFNDYFSGVDQLPQLPIKVKDINDLNNLLQVEPPKVKPFLNSEKLLNSFPYEEIVHFS